MEKCENIWDTNNETYRKHDLLAVDGRKLALVGRWFIPL
jgi:hypothetical protein